MIARGYRFKLCPTAEQDALFRQFAGVCRLVYNLALEQRVLGPKHRHRYVQQAAELTRLRAEFDWIRAVYVSCQQQALRDLDRAFVNFFAGRARFPTPRKKGVNDTFRFPGREVETRRLNAKWSAVRLPKIGWVKFRDTRPSGARSRMPPSRAERTGGTSPLPARSSTRLRRTFGPPLGSTVAWQRPSPSRRARWCPSREPGLDRGRKAPRAARPLPPQAGFPAL